MKAGSQPRSHGSIILLQGVPHLRHQGQQHQAIRLREAVAHRLVHPRECQVLQGAAVHRLQGHQARVFRHHPAQVVAVHLPVEDHHLVAVPAHRAEVEDSFCSYILTL